MVRYTFWDLATFNYNQLLMLFEVVNKGTELWNKPTYLGMYSDSIQNIDFPSRVLRSQYSLYFH